MDSPDERRAKDRERKRMRRSRETPAEATERRRRNRERMRKRRAAVPEAPAVPPVPVRQIDPAPSRFRIDPHTLMPVYEDKCPLAAARRIMGMP